MTAIPTASIPFGLGGCTVELVPATAPERADDRGAAERLIVTLPDGRADIFRLQDYARVYNYAGLYEEVVHNQLGCASPTVVAILLIAGAARCRLRPADLRVLDIAAGGGVSGEAIAEHGVRHIVGLDSITEARAAAHRDRPDLYTDYFVGDITDTRAMRDLIDRHRINAITCVGALGHLPFDAFSRVVALLPSGSLLAASFYDALSTTTDPIDDPDSLVAAYFRKECRARRLQALQSLHFHHRLAMNGDAIPGAAVVSRRLHRTGFVARHYEGLLKGT